MAQTINNMVRNSCAVPIAIGIMVVGLFFFCTRRISEGGFLFMLALGCAVWIIGQMLPAYTGPNIAQLNFATSQQNLLAEKEKTKRLKFQTILTFLALAGGIIKLLILLLSKIHFGH